jgi:hypothetical protein
VLAQHLHLSLVNEIFTEPLPMAVSSGLLAQRVDMLIRRALRCGVFSGLITIRLSVSKEIFASQKGRPVLKGQSGKDLASVSCCRWIVK